MGAFGRSRDQKNKIIFEVASNSHGKHRASLLAWLCQLVCPGKAKVELVNFSQLPTKELGGVGSRSGVHTVHGSSFWNNNIKKDLMAHTIFFSLHMLYIIFGGLFFFLVMFNFLMNNNCIYSWANL